jgi:TIR domain
MLGGRRGRWARAEIFDAIKAVEVRTEQSQLAMPHSQQLVPGLLEWREVASAHGLGHAYDVRRALELGPWRADDVAGTARSRTAPGPGGRAARAGSRRSRGTCASTSRRCETVLDMRGKDDVRRNWDFFVSYTQADRAWAEWIAWVLEEDGCQVFVQAWDFVPGNNWLAKMQAGTRDAARTIAVLSGGYLGSAYGSAEWQAALAADPDGTGRKLLVVRVADCQRPGLLAGIVSVDLFGISEPEARGRLREMVTSAKSGRAKPAAAPGFPGAVRTPPAGPGFPGGPQPSRAAGAGPHELHRPPPVNAQDMGLQPADPGISTRWDDFYDVDLVLRGRLLLLAPRSRPSRIPESARAGVLTALNDRQSLTSSGALDRFLREMDPQYRKPSDGWELDGSANAQEFTACWRASGHEARTVARTLLHVTLTPRPLPGCSLMITLGIQLTNPRRPPPPSSTPRLDALSADASQGQVALAILLDNRGSAPDPGGLPRPLPDYEPLTGLGGLGNLMLGTLGALWGPSGESLAVGILGQALGPPAHLDLALSATRFSANPVTPTLDRCIDFGTARPIRGNSPRSWTQLGPIQPDREFLSLATQQSVVRDWLIHLGIDNGYENVEQEVSRHEPYTK